MGPVCERRGICGARRYFIFDGVLMVSHPRFAGFSRGRLLAGFRRMAHGAARVGECRKKIASGSYGNDPGRQPATTCRENFAGSVIDAINRLPFGDGKRQGTKEEPEAVKLLALYLQMFVRA